MILGLSIAAFTIFHVILSLVGIGSGFVAVFGLVNNRLLPRWTALFLITTILTSVTGFLFPFHGFDPAIGLGVLSLIVLLLATVALYGGKLAGSCRGTFVIAAVIAQYFNVFVLFAQLFAKVPALKAVAPTQSSPVFGATQLVVIAGFIVLGVLAFRRFRKVLPA